MNFVWTGKLTQLSQESFNNEDPCVFAVITRLFQTAKRFTEEAINLEIRLILEQAGAMWDSKTNSQSSFNCFCPKINIWFNAHMLVILQGHQALTVKKKILENQAQSKWLAKEHNRMLPCQDTFFIRPGMPGKSFLTPLCYCPDNIDRCYSSKAFPGGQSRDVRKENTPAPLITPACQHVADEDCASSRWTSWHKLSILIWYQTFFKRQNNKMYFGTWLKFVFMSYLGITDFVALWLSNVHLPLFHRTHLLSSPFFFFF